MKVAVVFDDLIQFGGAERLLLAVHELYPSAPVYSSVASVEWSKRCADLHIDLRTSFMQTLPFKRALNRFYGLLSLHALAFESFQFDSFDIVLSISARFAHGIITKPDTTHVCYMNSPGRMFWESHDYFEREGFLANRVIRKLFRFFSVFPLSSRRLCDYASAQRADYFIANALTPKERIKKYYRRDSVIIHPFVDMIGGGSSRDGIAGDYFLIITRLNAWKRVDIAIEACKKVGTRVKILGEGPDRKRLEALSGSLGADVELLGYVDEQEKIAAILGCKALIVTQKEDFGITALEAMSLGKPVVAYRSGGVLETVVEGVTGEFFDVQSADSLASTLQQFDASLYKFSDCVSRASKFSKQEFIRRLDEFVKKVYDVKHMYVGNGTE